MTQSTNHSDDQASFAKLIDEIGTLSSPHPELSQKIFFETRAVLSRRRWWRRGCHAAVLMGCYLIGVYSGFVWKTNPGTGPHPVARHSNEAPEEQTRTPDQALSPLTKRIQEVATRGVTPSELTNAKPSSEITKEGSTKERSQETVRSLSAFESLRKAGDRQLFERGNIRGAIDLYRRAVARATEVELQIEIERDSWLLISLKQSRMEERKHVRTKRA